MITHEIFTGLLLLLLFLVVIGVNDERDGGDPLQCFDSGRCCVSYSPKSFVDVGVRALVHVTNYEQIRI